VLAIPIPTAPTPQMVKRTCEVFPFG